MSSNGSTVVAEPPVPPAIPHKHNSSNAVVSKNSFETVLLLSNECMWASTHFDLHRTCYLSRVCQHSLPKAMQFYEIDAVIQEGPTCGFAAIAMLLSSQPSAQELITEAMRRQLTLNGEMFSAADLLEMVQWGWDQHKTTSSDDTSVNKVTMQLHEGELNCDYVKEKLTHGAFILVAYDADVDHRPTCNKGHRAHWALIVGYLIDNGNNFHVFARHGKTENMSLWNMESLSASNSNLVEFVQPRSHLEKTFRLPPGGINGPNGICSKAIIIEGFPSTNLIELNDF